MIPGWLRKLPHPTYGKFCGQKANGSAFGNNAPVDALDCACYEHDKQCFEAEQLDDPLATEIEKGHADNMFAFILRSKLGPFKYKIWGPIYQRLARIVFRPRRIS